MTPKLFSTRRTLLLGTVQAAVSLTLSRHAFAVEALPKMVVTRDPTCGCCGGWVAHVEAAGFPVEVVEATDFAPLKARLGIPEDLVACHTGEVAGYVIEGHVPAGAIKRLIAERAQATGLAVPGMPAGSPGMEAPDTPAEPYEVILFGPGLERVFARYRGADEI